MDATTKTTAGQTARQYVELREQGAALVKYLRDRVPASERRDRLLTKAFTRFMRRKNSSWVSL